MQALIALQPHQPPAQRRRQHLGDERVVDPAELVTLEPPVAEVERDRGLVAAVGDVDVFGNAGLIASAEAAAEAGRDAFLAGRIQKKLYATASSPTSGIIAGE